MLHLMKGVFILMPLLYGHTNPHNRWTKVGTFLKRARAFLSRGYHNLSDPQLGTEVFGQEVFPVPKIKLKWSKEVMAAMTIDGIEQADTFLSARYDPGKEPDRRCFVMRLQEGKIPGSTMNCVES